MKFQSEIVIIEDVVKVWYFFKAADKMIEAVFVMSG